MNISENNFKKLKTIINELMELSNKLPDIANNIVNTNINYRAFILNQWIENPNKDINYYINTEELDEYKQCTDCGKLLKLSDLKPHNKYEQYNDVFCDDCLEHCPVCGVLFADYFESGKCDRCAD